MTGEIVNGELVVTPKPAPRHANAAFALSSELGPPYRFGRSVGPGGWVILSDVEVMFGEVLLVPDFLAIALIGATIHLSSPREGQ
jgi:hypothetical protein